MSDRKSATGKLATALARGEFVLTSEIVPPVSCDRGDLLAMAEPLAPYVQALNVTDGPGGQVHMSPLAAAAILIEAGIEPVLQLTCRDRNRIALLGALVGAGAIGVNNLLFLYGDKPADESLGASTVYDSTSLDLIGWARDMSVAGTLPHGVSLKVRPSFFVAAADAPAVPGGPPWRPDGLIAKHAAGARFVQTQLCYDIDVARAYMASLKEHGLADKLHILIGTGPLASAKSARWMNANLFGVHVPEHIIAQLEAADDPRAKGRELCLEFVAQLRELGGVGGVHVMAPGNAKMLPGLLAELGGAA